MSDTRPTPEPQQPSRPDPETTRAMGGWDQSQQPEQPQEQQPMRGPDFTRPIPPYDPTAQAAAGGGDAGGPAGPYGQMPTPTPPPGYPLGRSKRRFGAAAAAAVLAAGLIGGGVGATGMYLLGPETTQSSDGAPTLQQVPQGSTTTKAAEGSVQAAAEKVLPSVVSIEMQSQQGTGGGSGVVLTKDGMILTNNHVAEVGQQGGTLQVTFNDGKTVNAEVVGLDPVTDLAVIKAQGVSDLKPAQLGNSSSLSVGQDVVAIGSPLGLSGTVTSGIVSALNRPVDTTDESTARTNTVIDAIQTDAAINPGNSGGALVDMDGNLIGINSAILTTSGSSETGNIGLGFSIPIDEAKPIAEQLMQDGSADHAQLGVSQSSQSYFQGTQPGATETEGGAKIDEVTPDSAAAKAGLQVGDVITKVDDRKISDFNSLVAAVRSFRPGDKVTVTYERNGEEQTADVTLDSDGGGN